MSLKNPAIWLVEDSLDITQKQDLPYKHGLWWEAKNYNSFYLK